MWAWTVLYLPTGFINGFVTIALTYSATRSGLTIAQGSWIVGAMALVSWLKWLWAPLVDVTLTPSRWYLLSAIGTALGVWAMAWLPLSQENIYYLTVVVALAAFCISLNGMAVEALIARLSAAQQFGEVGAWFQSGSLIGTGLGGALGLYLFLSAPQPWISGAVIGILILVSSFGLAFLPGATDAEPQRTASSLRSVLREFRYLIKSPFGLRTAFLCLLPLATGAAQVTLTQAAVAEFWGAGAREVGLVQGLLAGCVSTLGCYFGGRWFTPENAHRNFIATAIFLATVALVMAVLPRTVPVYIAGNLLYAIGVGATYAAFTAMVLMSIGPRVASTGYNVFASLANFPYWWMSLLLGYTAEYFGVRAMLLTEAGIGFLGVVLFALIFLPAWGKLRENRVPEFVPADCVKFHS